MTDSIEKNCSKLDFLLLKPMEFFFQKPQHEIKFLMQAYKT